MDKTQKLPDDSLPAKEWIEEYQKMGSENDFMIAEARQRGESDEEIKSFLRVWG
ncbi:MAG: hypothetical protein K6F68_08710 [Clostridiales bacterium]|nr:hypothetical protein [Clostridiales bacterium]